MGKSQSTIANKLRLLKLPEDIQRNLVEYDLTERHGRALLKLPDNELRREVLEKNRKEWIECKQNRRLSK